MKILNDLTELSTCTPGDQVVFTALLTDIKQQMTQTSKEYVRLYFRDSKGSTTIPLWNDTLESANKAYEIDTIYRITASTQEFNSATVISKINSVNVETDEKYTKRFKQYLYKKPTDACKNTVLAAVRKLMPTAFGPYIKAVYGDGSDSCPEFLLLTEAYASINHHDNYPGGFINHVGGMLRIASMLKSNYLEARCEERWTVDWVFITAAILLHDIGKLQTYSAVTDKLIRFKDGCLLDHNKIGVGMLYMLHDHVDEAERLGYETFQQLAYTICYHDDKDKLYSHKRLEDRIIAYIDGLDAVLAVACEFNIQEDI